MNEKGFFTVVALGLLLVIVLLIKSVQETEKNYANGATDFEIESELQNIADGGIYEAAEKIQSKIITVPNPSTIYANRREIQHKISVTQPQISDRFKNISVEVFAERGKIEKYRRNYSAEDDYTGGKGYKDEDLNFKKDGVILISVASGEDKITGAKKFRRSLAYILDDDKENIFFMTDAERGSLNP